MIAEKGGNCYLGTSLTGSPTMTTQRIETLMTGSDIFSSANIIKTFLSSKLGIDNIPSQLLSANKSSIVFGDDTWIKLFDFSSNKVCENTYDIQDYDSCDANVYKYLSEAAITHRLPNREVKHKYDFLVGHFLAIDHIGHATSSITDKQIDVKLNQISSFLKHLIKIMDDETILIVTGDHGMRADGNHGGTSKE